MMVLVIGPNGSGKSAYAERLASCICTGNLYYIATLLPYGQEGAARVEKHRLQRANIGFVTLESPYALAAETSGQDTALLEDISNLVGNLMFERKDYNTEDTALDCVLHLRKNCGNLICVSISDIDVVDGDNEETKHYIAVLKRVNDKLFEYADAVVEMVAGTPALRKGILPCIH